MNDKNEQIKIECIRQSESCLYTSTTFHIWLRSSRFWLRVFVTAPVILGALASWSVFDDSETKVAFLSWITAISALGAGIFPALFVALDMNTNVKEISRLSAEFKNLQDRFRIAAKIKSKGDTEQFENIVDELMNRLDIARSNSLTPPERFFKKAQKKINEGDYYFSVDQKPE